MGTNTRTLAVRFCGDDGVGTVLRKFSAVPVNDHYFVRNSIGVYDERIQRTNHD